MWTLIDSFDGTIVGYAETPGDVLDHPGHSHLHGDLIVARGMLTQDEAITISIQIREELRDEFGPTLKG